MFTVSIVFKDTDGSQTTKVFSGIGAMDAAALLSTYACNDKIEIVQFAINSPQALQAQRALMGNIARSTQQQAPPAAQQQAATAKKK